MPSPRRRVLIVPLLAVVLGTSGMYVAPRLADGDAGRYAHVASLKHSREYQDPELLARAWAQPVGALYQRGGFQSQRNGSFCGPTSLANVLRSRGTPADQKDLLTDTGTLTLFGVLPSGLTLDRLAEIANKKTGLRVTVLRDLDLATFRQHVAASADPARRYVVNFHRGPLFGQGGGHHSPLGGYLADRDLVLVLDVNAQYAPWLVPTERLFQAVDTVDPATGRKRGLLLLE